MSPDLTVGGTTYTPEDNIVERLQVAGLMAPDGEVDRILETVVNNLLIVNNLDLAAVRCRVLLTTPLESFVLGRTIVVSRGLLDVLPDEATLAAVLAHELAHIVLEHSLGAEYACLFRTWKSSPSLTSVSTRRKKRTLTGRARNCFRSRRIRTRPRVCRSFCKRWRLAPRNCPVCCKHD